MFRGKFALIAFPDVTDLCIKYVILVLSKINIAIEKWPQMLQESGISLNIWATVSTTQR